MESSAMFMKRNSIGIVLLHAALVFLSVVLSWLLRFDFKLPHLAVLLFLAPVLILYRLAAMARFGLLHGYWSHTGIHDVPEMIKAIALGSAGFLLTSRYWLGIHAFPVSVYALEAIVTTAILLGVRIAWRLLRQRTESSQRSGDRRRAQRVLIAGAGFAGQLLIRELQQSSSRWEAVGCVDDDANKIGAKIHGVPVLGTIDQIAALSAEHRAFELLIAIPSATAAQMQHLVEICDKAGVKYKTVPSLRDFVAGQSSVQQLREVNLEDLLGRDPIELDLEPVRKKLKGNQVLVTGAAGSIGSELASQILQYEPAVLVCVDQDETGLFELQQKLRKASVTTKVEYCLADVTDSKRILSVLSRYEIDTVFHAAAYKHVSLTEDNLCEVLENNVSGLLSMLDAAEESHCSSFVLISSDKAVNPTSFMGCTKRIGELILAARPTSSMRCVTVRFGNVLGSQGSVVPLFQQQIRARKQITVTHPEVTRYFMTIPEAVTLVLQAFVIGEHGDLLVLDMGKPLRILDVARTLMKLSGVNEAEVKIEFTGLRPGEKLHEELFYDYEEQHTTPVGKITQAKSKASNWNTLAKQLDVLLTMGAEEMYSEVRTQVKQIIPEYDIDERFLVQPGLLQSLRAEPHAVGAD
jgi:FlaA1/EpsC-like NDP-sugar epimerase